MLVVGSAGGSLLGLRLKDVLIEARARRLEAAELRSVLPYLRSEKTVVLVMQHVAEQEARAVALERQAEELRRSSAEISPPISPNRSSRR
jgi:hypothetical protein